LDHVRENSNPSRARDEENDWRRSGPQCSWRRFLADYSANLEALAALPTLAGSSFRTLRESEKELWGTLLPIAARVIMESPEVAPGAAALDIARRWALSRIARVLAAAWWTGQE
jgi:hypothetical protein